MRITAFSVRNPQFTLVALLCLLALGVTSLMTIPRSEDPYFPTPNYLVVAVYPGASAEEVEQDVAAPLEEELAELGELKHLRTRIEDGVAVIQVEFEAGIDTARKEDEVRRQVAAAQGDLPDGVRDVDVKHLETTNVAILQLALVTDAPDAAALRTASERLIPRLERVPGVKGVDGWGTPDLEARVELDLGRMAAAGLSATQLIGLLGGSNASIPGGDVALGGRRFDVQTSGALAGEAELRDLVISPGTGAQVRLADVADVEVRPADATYVARFDGARAAFVTVTMRDGENIFSVRDAVLDVIAAERGRLPPGVRLEVGFDQSVNVDHRLGGLRRDFAIAIVLVLVTLLPLGLRASLVVMVAIPTSLALGVAALHLLGFSLNQLSIVGFVIALGLLVDDSIVVAENIARHLREGKGRVEAAIAASRQIGIAVVGCTATLIFAFLPLLFLPGNAGTFIRSLPVAVVVTIAASLLVSLTLIPFLASRVMQRGAAAGHADHGNLAFRVMNRAIEAAYRPVLALAMRRKAATLVVATALVAGAFALIPRIGFSLFPKAGIPQVMVRITAAEGTSLDGTDAIARAAEAIVRAEPAVAHVLTSVGQGNPQVYYNVGPRAPSPVVADLFVQLHHYDVDATPAMLDRLRAALRRIPGAEIDVREFENGPPIEAPIAIRVFGDDLDELRRQAGVVAERLAALPGTRDVRNPLAIGRTDLEVAIDPGRAALAGVTEVDVDRTVRLSLTGLTVGTLRQPGGDEIDLVVGLPRERRPDLGALDAALVPTVTGGHVPLAQVAEARLRSSPRLIQRDGRERVVTVTAEVETSANAQQVTRAALASMAALELPDDLRWEAGGLVESQQESFAGMGPAILIAVFGVLAILVLEFRSFAATLIVASVIPLGTAGGLLALYLFGETLSFVATIGFIALVGIEVKNSILLVDFTNQLRAEGLSLDDAIRRAGEIRFFPILLTSLTAIGGLVPLVLEYSAMYSPLALVLIGGLISSTILSRLVTPVMSRLLLPKHHPVGELATGDAAAATPGDAPTAG
ncbi:MAG: efflux RND transporter permease subunit [Kofleriaceae bacterium]